MRRRIKGQDRNSYVYAVYITRRRMTEEVEEEEEEEYQGGK